MIRLLSAHSVPVTVAAWAVAVLVWLLDAVDRGPGRAVQGVVALAAVTALVLHAMLAACRSWTGRSEVDRGAARWLLALVAASFALHFTGLGHEITSRYFGDEGIYLSRAEKVNQGKVLQAWFVYPHLLFYLDALALWLAALFAPAVQWLASLVYGVDGPKEVAVLVTRGVTATCGALTVIPVFHLARRIAGDAAGLLGATCVLFSHLYLATAHLNISDVVGAFFAALALAQVASLLDEEHSRGYLLAGLCAGLAAGGKYPAGVVAVAIVAIWIRWRLRRRAFGAGLLWAGLSAVAAFLATTPSLLAFPEAAFTGKGTDVLFGYRQYARGGWIGVVKNSNTLFYLRSLGSNFGWPLLAAALVGLLGLRSAGRARLLWMLPFPIVYLGLLATMNIAVPRNLLPVLPALAAIAGVGVASGLRWAEGLRAPARRAAIGLALAVLLALPAYRSAVRVGKLARATTREVAAAWLQRNLPPGSFLVQEAYTPRLGPAHRFPSRRARFVARLSPEELYQPRHDFVLVASAAYDRFLKPKNPARADLDPFARRYRELFERCELVREFQPGRWRGGPVLKLYKVDPVPLPFEPEQSLPAGGALLRSEGMRRPDGSAVFGDAAQWGLFKAYLPAGRYRVEVDADRPAGGGTLRVSNRDNEAVAEARTLRPDAAAEVDLPRPDKYFLYVSLPAGSRLRGLEIRLIH